MRKLAVVAALATLLAGTALRAADEKPRAYTLVVRGAVWPGCAGQLAKSIQSVEGTKVLVPPSKGTGTEALTITQVELTGKANLAGLAAAIAGANTPHKGQNAPDIVAVVPGRLKSTATPEGIMDALRKAGLLE